MCRLLLATILFFPANVAISQISNRKNLTDEQVEKLHKLIRPTDEEAAFLKIPWETSIHAARVKAAKQGKPMLLFMIHGHLLSGL